MGLGYTPAIPFNPLKSIKILTQHVRDNERRKEKEQTVEEEEDSDTGDNALTVYLQKKQLHYNMKVEKGNRGKGRCKQLKLKTNTCRQI